MDLDFCLEQGISLVHPINRDSPKKTGGRREQRSCTGESESGVFFFESGAGGVCVPPRGCVTLGAWLSSGNASHRRVVWSGVLFFFVWDQPNLTGMTGYGTLGTYLPGYVHWIGGSGAERERERCGILILCTCITPGWYVRYGYGFRETFLRGGERHKQASFFLALYFLAIKAIICF